MAFRAPENRYYRSGLQPLQCWTLSKDGKDLLDRPVLRDLARHTTSGAIPHKYGDHDRLGYRLATHIYLTGERLSSKDECRRCKTTPIYKGCVIAFGVQHGACATCVHSSGAKYCSLSSRSSGPALDSTSDLSGVEDGESLANEASYAVAKGNKRQRVGSGKDAKITTTGASLSCLKESKTPVAISSTAAATQDNNPVLRNRELLCQYFGLMMGEISGQIATGGYDHLDAHIFNELSFGQVHDREKNCIIPFIRADSGLTLDGIDTSTLCAFLEKGQDDLSYPLIFQAAANGLPKQTVANNNTLAAYTAGPGQSSTSTLRDTVRRESGASATAKRSWAAATMDDSSYYTSDDDTSEDETCEYDSTDDATTKDDTTEDDTFEDDTTEGEY
ncbi:hypothetical protein AFLA_002963 [Aspergillus flavus NRRL3357]|nr:uncharacterized protein G4B84_001891 [Aspergillus flavus NRRL3357]KAF7627585.1 hypothetical protein AFLA_002963 [Aspergillus flavus NRRL3357]QMW26646.1 hypothetical protein G4B84_001891 [Aspergillus flavus NRRL3357]QMW38725.1 hypothetical protein G4B11_001961 [Aspergillus flavus]